MKRDKYNFVDPRCDDIRKAVKESEIINCDYAFEICSRCGNFYTDPEGNVSSATIVEKCEHCFRLNDEDLRKELREFY